MNFAALDVETANCNLASICQIGIVFFEDGKVVKQWQTLVNPEDYFDPINIDIHGITEDMVAKSPTFPVLAEQLCAMLAKRIVATHTPIDKAAMNRSAERYGISPVVCTWIDTARVARRAWLDVAKVGYGLENLAETLAIQYEPHIAQEDARAAGEVLVRAILQTGIGLDDWLVRVNQPISPLFSPKVAREGNPEGNLAGEVIVFTGALSIPRGKAADLAAQAGCNVEDSVNKRTTFLVVGDQDARKLVGHDKSTKHRRAEELVRKGQTIRILCESDFIDLVDQK